MHPITLAQLVKRHRKTDNLCIELLRLRSFECSLYLVELVIEDETYLVKDEQGKMLSFRSVLAAKKPFKGFNIARAELVQESAYDEMIGQPVGDEKNTLRVSLGLPADDLS
jgi:predicted RNA-binding protein